VTDRPVTLVLDTSAIIAYTRAETAIHVGDVLVQVVDEDALAVLPASCLAEALPSVADPDMLDLLVAHEATTVLADGPDMWRDLAAMVEITGRPDSASAALAAIDFTASILTRAPLLYAGLRDGRMVIPIGE
jgi:hypothetical protein